MPPIPSAVPTPAGVFHEYWEFAPGPEPSGLTRALADAKWKAEHPRVSYSGLGPPIFLRPLCKGRDLARVANNAPPTPSSWPTPVQAPTLHGRGPVAPGGVIGEGYRGPRAPTPVSRVRMSPGERLDDSDIARQMQQLQRSAALSDEDDEDDDDQHDIDVVAVGWFEAIRSDPGYATMCASRPTEKAYTSWVVSAAESIYGETDNDVLQALGCVCHRAFPKAMGTRDCEARSRDRAYAAVARFRGCLPETFPSPAFSSTPSAQVASSRLNEAVSDSFVLAQSALSLAISRPNAWIQARPPAQRARQEFQEGDFRQCWSI